MPLPDPATPVVGTPGPVADPSSTAHGAAPLSGMVDLLVATLLAAMLIGVLATALAQRFAVSGVVFSVSPAIPLVPGTYAYKAVMGILMVADSSHRERSVTRCAGFGT